MVLELVGNLRQKYIYTKAHEYKHTTTKYTHTNTHTEYREKHSGRHITL